MAEFTRFQAFAFLFVIIAFSLCGVVNVIWSWTLSHWSTKLMAPYFLRLSIFLTLAGTLQLVLAVAIFFSSYLVEKRRSLFLATVIGSSLLMFALLVPFSLSAARAAGEDFRQDLVENLEEEVAFNKSDGILAAAYLKFNCCGIAKETVCLRFYPPILLKNGTETPCQAGSSLCSEGCLSQIWQKWVKPPKTIGWILADISFAISVISPILFLTALYKHYAPRRNKRKLRGVNWRKLLSKSVKDAYGDDKNSYEHVPPSRYSF